MTDLKFIKVVFVIIAFSITSISAATAFAHGVKIFAYPENGHIFVEGYFADGSAVSNSSVDVFNEKTGEWLMQLITDSKGKARFKAGEVTPLKLAMDAGFGHKGFYIVSEEEIRLAMGNGGALKREEAISGAATKGDFNKRQSVSMLSASDVETIVESVVDRKLEPIKNIVIKIEKAISKPGLSEIIAGIGYIFGFMGIVAYYKSRKER